MKEVENGEAVVITRHGRPAAVLGPYRAATAPDRERAIERVVALMRNGLPLGGRQFTRGEMHEPR